MYTVSKLLSQTPDSAKGLSHLSQELRPSVESGKALARTSRANKNIQIICLRFSSEGLRDLGKFNRRLPKLVWELHTNFAEIQMQDSTFDATATPTF